MEPYPSTTQNGHDLTDAMYQLFGGEQQRGLSVLQQQQQAMECSASPKFSRMSQQPSSTVFQHQAAPHPMKWAAKRIVGGFTGPPVETGATLPYREPRAPISFSHACAATTGVSRSVTSGARQPQAQLQLPTSTENPLTSASQLMFPAFASSDAQTLSQASMAFKHFAAVQFPLSVAAGLAPSLLTKGSLHTTPSGSALPGTSTSLDNVPASKPGAWSKSKPAAFQSHVFMPTQSLTLPEDGEAGAWTSASMDLPVAQSLSLNSTTSKEAGELLTAPSTRDLPPSDDDSERKQAAAAAAAAAVEGQQHTMLREHPAGEPAEEVQHEDEGGNEEAHRQNPPSNQSSGSHQEGRRDQGDVGPCGSQEYCVAFGEQTQQTLQHEAPDSGSDSDDMSAKGGKRCRGTSSEVQGSATDADPGPRLKKRLDQIRQPEGLTDGRKMTDAEKRRIRRRVTNRESAKRIRDKREEQMTLMSAQVTKLEAHREALLSHMHSAQDCCAQLTEELKRLKNKWCATCVENVKLYKNIFELRKALNPDAASSYLASQIALTDDHPGGSCPPMPLPTPPPVAAPQSRCDSGGAVDNELSRPSGPDAPEARSQAGQP